MSAPGLAADIVTSWTLKNGLVNADDSRRIEAQRALLEWVEDEVERRRKADNWDQHVTRDVFEAIASKHLDLYTRAVEGGHKTQLNREIGALIRRGLGAVVREQSGQRLYGQLRRRDQSLIKTYTYLFRPDHRDEGSWIG